MHKIIVIGGGVAGLQAGVFTAKAGEDTLVLDTGESLVFSTSNIQNLIGHDSVAGSELISSGKNKLEEFGGEYMEEEVEEVERTPTGFRVETSDGSYESEYIVVATAGELGFLSSLDLDYEDGKDEAYMMDRHVETDESNRAAEGVYAAGLANSWEYQTSTAIGDGAKAALNLLSEIGGEPYTDHDT